MAFGRVKLNSWTRPCFLAVHIRTTSNIGKKGPGSFDPLNSLVQPTATGPRHFRAKSRQIKIPLPVINGKEIYFPFVNSSEDSDMNFGFVVVATMGAAEDMAGAMMTPMSDGHSFEGANEDVLKSFEVPRSAEIAARLFHDVETRAYEARHRLARARLAALSQSAEKVPCLRYCERKESRDLEEASTVSLLPSCSTVPIMAVSKARLATLARSSFLRLQVRCCASNVGNQGPAIYDDRGRLTGISHQDLRRDILQITGHIPIMNGRDISFPHGNMRAGALVPPMSYNKLSEVGSNDVLKAFEVPRSKEIAARLFEDAHKNAYVARRALARSRLSDRATMTHEEYLRFRSSQSKESGADGQ